MSDGGKSLIVITGASSGIGEDTAKQFHSLGHPLLLLARRVDRMKKLGLENAMCEKVDVTDIKKIRKAVAAAEKKFNQSVDCIVNNAGVMMLEQFANQKQSEWQAMIDVNVHGVMNGIYAVIKGMYERKHGTVINVGSIAGTKIFPDHAVYCGTKFAVHAVGEAIRQESLKHNVRVTTIAPGVVETELLSHTTNDQIKSDYETWKQGMGGALTSADVARAIVYAYEQPQHVCIREIILAATGQEM
ncbi:SDR family oxidoreductase [Poriferisphaera sp. WC338]|uniref:SDR family oxidoreductase n=1 Tax=Poriferisphaera sp. WC338 TaxID=3425129 RepID=UPI003D8155BF